MTRQHFAFLADLILTSSASESARREFAERCIKAALTSNHRFNAKRFWDACGLGLSPDDRPNHEPEV
jgi:hypothetical protein